MTDIPQVDDQFVEEANTDPALREPSGYDVVVDTGPRYMPTPEGRFPLLCAMDFDFDELRVALNAAGFALTGHAEGWYLDKVHAIALVKAANESEGESNAE